MTNNNDRVIDNNHGIEHILEGREHAYYPWFRNAVCKPLYYLSKAASEGRNWRNQFTRVRFTSCDEAYNFLAFQRGLPGLPYPIAQGKEIENSLGDR